jgi:[citrate (pro-3S)-lyase] ligase
LSQYLDSIRLKAPQIGAIVMNCNPFTLGHRHLVEYAANKCLKLFVFVVEENSSEFPFSDRFELVKQGVSDLTNAEVLSSGKFIISRLTFPAYSDKANLQDEVIDMTLDVELFAKHIAPTLGITVRFAGEEPLDNVTRQYNQAMKQLLPNYGIQFEAIQRLEDSSGAISASRVRELLKIQDFDNIAKLVPPTTLEYLKRYDKK